MKYQIHLVVVSLTSLLWAQNPQLSEPAYYPALTGSDSLVTEWRINHTLDANYGELFSTLADGGGNFYVLGWSAQGLGILKYDASGNFLWDEYRPSQRYYLEDVHGNSSWTHPFADADTQGNLYLSIVERNDSTDFDILNLKYDASGQLAWQQLYNGTADGIDLPKGIVMDGDTALYMIGQSAGEDGYPNTLIIRHDSSGAVQWQAILDGPAFTFYIPKGIHLDYEGSIIVYGIAYDQLHGQKILLVKYSKDGTLQWSQIFQDDTIQWEACALRSDGQGNLYLLGKERGINPRFLYDFRLWKYDQDGTLQWSRAKENTSLADVSHPTPSVFQLDSSGNSYLLFGAGGSILCMKFNDSGSLLWESSFRRNDLSFPLSIWLTTSGDLYVTGYTARYERTCDHCPTTFPESIVIAKMDNNGNQTAIHLESVDVNGWAPYYFRYSNSNADKAYITISSYTDCAPPPDMCHYTIKFNLSNILAVVPSGNLPTSFVLYPNYPNPFNPVTTIGYELPEGAMVRLMVYDLRGREVARLIDGYRQLGFH
ncbi:hypothetical protein ACFL5M_06180, partial [Candidatus Neomarinimicrobiota bacterium]